jgi:hypothetical protein
MLWVVTHLPQKGQAQQGEAETTPEMSGHQLLNDRIEHASKSATKGK